MTRFVVAVDDSPVSKNTLLWAARSLVRGSDTLDIITVLEPALRADFGNVGETNFPTEEVGECKPDPLALQQRQKLLKESKDAVAKEGVRPGARRRRPGVMLAPGWLAGWLELPTANSWLLPWRLEACPHATPGPCGAAPPAWPTCPVLWVCAPPLPPPPRPPLRSSRSPWSPWWPAPAGATTWAGEWAVVLLLLPRHLQLPTADRCC